MAKRNQTSTDDFLKLLDEEEKDSSAMWSTHGKANETTILSPDQNKLEPKLSQTKVKVKPNLSQQNTKVKPNLSQQKAKLEPQPEPVLEPKLSQTEAKVEPKLGFSSLVGLQRKILFIFYEECRFAGSKITPPLAIENIAISVRTTTSATRKAIQRLEEKCFVTRSTFKNGRGGWTQYLLLDAIYQELTFTQTEAKVEPKLSQTEAKLRTELEPQLEPRSTSSSSVLNISNKTTTKPTLENSEWLESINLDAVQNAGVTKSVLKRCMDLYPVLTPEKLEDLVFRFAEFMKEPKNRVQNARGFFIGLAKQLSEGITPLDHIETANDRLMREYTEKLREKKERKIKLDKEAMEFEFEAWVEKLAPSNQIELIPENQFSKQGSAPHRAALKQHFSERIWPEKKQQILESLITAHEVIVFQDSEKN